MILWALIGLLGTTLLFRQGGVNQFANFAFPKTISLPGRTLIQSEALSPLEEMQIASQVIEQASLDETLPSDTILTIRQEQQGADIFMSGHRYQYENPDHSERLMATFRYIVNVDPGSDLATYYQRQNPDSEFFKNFKTKDKNISNLEGNILSFVNQNSLYYSACLTPDQQTNTQSYNQITK